MGAATEPTVPTAISAKQGLGAATNGAGGVTDVATVASGCFWGTEHIFREHYGSGRGLIDAKVGFIGGKESSKDPSYEEVCTGRTGHAEATQIKFDPTKVTYAELVEFFYRTHDPTQLNAQGNDRGTQYRSALFPHDADQLGAAQKVTQEVQDKYFGPKGRKIVTQIEQRPAGDFFVAAEYHQRYLEHNPFGYQCSNHKLWW
ncbi:methionine sulfoxide reductase A [Acaromyces ingoldii]|uniref:peptide-methionine (S)-S-oxide reductase n=1 Tax=Acaromyces ingoldii TaxID=215250 RepID=A0A316YH94_9BASI|nr:methionine sulfoxide reductase A [Acaromyces ingoldii]PWN87115.1 methionine sulfoxide reductase A [Acaromyces ingoldii]